MQALGVQDDRLPRDMYHTISLRYRRYLVIAMHSSRGSSGERARARAEINGKRVVIYAVGPLLIRV